MNPVLAALKGAGYLNRRTFSPNFLKNRLATTRAYLEGLDVVKGFPSKIHIELTNVCNLDCIMCPRRYMKRKTGMMEREVLGKIVSEIGGKVEFAYLHLFGESLLNPLLFEAIKLLKSAGVSTGLATNATVLDEEKSKALISSGLDFLVISFDGADRETYEAIRVKGRFEKTLSNVETFLRIKSSSNSRAPHTAIQVIEMKGTEKVLNPYVDFWKKHPVESIRIKPLQTWSGDMKDINSLSKDGVEMPCHKCDRLWRHICILWDGTVVPCEFDFDASSPLGNITTSTLESLWNGDVMRGLRKMHSEGRRSGVKLCEKCNYRSPSTIDNAGIVFLDTLTTTKLISLLGK